MNAEAEKGLGSASGLWQDGLDSDDRVRISARRGVGMLEVGTAAPDFTVKDHEGQSVSLADFRGRKVLLWFYPKADTPG